jgi:hypothetical protein
MPTLTPGQLVWLPNSLDTDNAPIIGKIFAVATDANVVSFDAAPGADVGDSTVPTSVSFTDQAIGFFLDVDGYTTIPPGSIVRIRLPGLSGNPDIDVYAYVIRSFTVTQLGEGDSVFTGQPVGADTTLPFLYVEILTDCTPPAANLVRGGQRQLIPLFNGQTAVTLANAGIGARYYTP